MSFRLPALLAAAAALTLSAPALSSVDALRPTW